MEKKEQLDPTQTARMKKLEAAHPASAASLEQCASACQLTRHFYRASSCRRSSPRTARSRVFILISRAFGLICCAEQIGFVYEDLLPRNVRSSPLENLPSIPGAARANIPAQGSVPRRIGSSRHWCL